MSCVITLVIVMALWFKAFPKAVQMFIPKAMKASSGTEVLFFAAVLSSAGYGTSLLIRHETDRAAKDYPGRP